MRRFVILALLAAHFTAAGVVHAQDEAAEKPSPSAILDLAAKAQGGGEKSDAEQLSFSIDMLVRAKDEQGNRVEVEVQRKFQAPHFLWSRLYDGFSKEEAIKGFDGKRFWLKSGGSVRWLDGADFVDDRRKAEREIDETLLYARVFFVRNLKGELKELQRLPDEEGFGHKAWVVQGQARWPRADADEPAPVQVKLWVDQVSHAVLGARITHVGSTELPIQLCFTRHRRGKDGVLVPGQIEVFRGDEKAPRQTVYPSNIRFGVKFKPKDFSPN